MRDQLETFAVIDTDKDGIITLEDYAKYHDLPICSPLKLLYSAFDPVSDPQLGVSTILATLQSTLELWVNNEE